ncbi:MAG: methyltransferase domain-containing protein [bacterium]
MTVDNVMVKNRFFKVAAYYDQYAEIQQLIARQLANDFPYNKKIKNILEIGCGTGNYTKLLRIGFPNAKIKSIDISGYMIEVARGKLRDKGIDFIVADGELITWDIFFDFITSNATLQWFEDLEGSLLSYSRMLHSKGQISFSIFGKLTFFELDASVKELFGQDVCVAASRFISGDDLKKILARCFNSYYLFEEKCISVRYASIQELLNSLKYTGTIGKNPNKHLWTPRMLKKLEDIYKRRFGDITATYQVFKCIYPGVK